MGWEYNSHIVCMCIIMRWSRYHSASWAERFRTSSLLCTYKLCDYYSPIPILSLFLFTPSLYAPILNLQDFSFTCTQSTTVLCDISYFCFPQSHCKTYLLDLVLLYTQPVKIREVLRSVSSLVSLHQEEFHDHFLFHSQLRITLQVY